MSTSLRAAITALAQALKAGPVSSAEDALALAALIPALHQHLVPAAPTGAQEFMLDPRYALAMASFAESAGHQALRTQIYAAHLIEDSAAHTLTSDELDAVRAGTTDFSTRSNAAPHVPASPIPPHYWPRGSTPGFSRRNAVSRMPTTS